MALRLSLMHRIRRRRNLTITRDQLFWCRSIYSKTGQWVDNFDENVRKHVEEHWQTEIQEQGRRHEISPPKNDDTREKFYMLSMFPYPSGRLHMGHVRVYTISDTLAHYHRMMGKQVLHPMGWDAFGLPAENAAIERDLLPNDWTYRNVENMREQLKNLGFCFNWDREIFTCREDYYRWTQYLFLKMYDCGLAYQMQSVVNWDPIDLTVLADEQVDKNGCSWRSGAKVEKKYLKQWFLRTTKFAKPLKEGLGELGQWTNAVKAIQGSMIGECQGAELHFPLQCGEVEHLSVYVERPELVCGASHLTLPINHPVLRVESFLGQLGPGVREELLALRSQQPGERGHAHLRLDVSPLNPFTGTAVPLFVSGQDGWQAHFGRGHLGLPCHSDSDRQFAQAHSLPYRQVLEVRDGIEMIVNSGQFGGPAEKARKEVCEQAQQNDWGGYVSGPFLRDWLISRQRYWGTPFPIVHCPTCQVVPVPYEDLPVELPQVDNFTGKGRSPLAQVEDWVNVACPKCGQPAKREVDTMDTFVDSSWYFLRFTDPHNSDLPFDPDVSNFCMPVDLYVGGVEHADKHLLYARFIQQFLHSQGLSRHREPFKHLLVQGMVMGKSYKVKSSGQYVPASKINLSAKPLSVKETGEKVWIKWEKMSKSKHNGVDPEECLKQYGIDTLRLFILKAGAPAKDVKWDTKDINEILQWKNMMWSQVTRLIQLRSAPDPSGDGADLSPVGVSQQQNIKLLGGSCVYKVRTVFSDNYDFQEAIVQLRMLTWLLNQARAELVERSRVYEEALCNLCIMLAPMAPHLALELWGGIASAPRHLVGHRWDKNVFQQKWPDYSEEINVNVTINGKSVGSVTVPTHYVVDWDKDSIRDIVLKHKVGHTHLQNKTIRSTILNRKSVLMRFNVDD